MSIYQYTEGKVVDEVTFKRSPRDAVRAYLHARPEVDNAAIGETIRYLRANDLQCLPFNLDGKPVLEVRGFGNEQKLLKILRHKDLIDGTPEITPDAADHIDWKTKLHKRSLQGAGALYSIGDVSFFMYGLKGSSPLDMAAGILYGLPTPVLIAYGRNDQSELQIQDLAKDMADHFQQQVKTLPQDCSLEALTADRKKGLLNTPHELLQRFPSEFMNLCYAGAGACIMAAGIKHLKLYGAEGPPEKAIEGWLKHLRETDGLATTEMATAKALDSVRKENYLNVGVGATTISAGLFGALVKEKAPDPDERRKKGIEGMWDWVRERPLAVTGAGFMVSTLLHAVSTAVAVAGKDPNHKEAIGWRALFVGSALVAEILVAISSKGHGEGVVSDKSVDESVIAMAADLIVKQPIEMQDALIKHMGGFLGRPDVLSIRDRDATEILRQQVEIIRHNQWALADDNGPCCYTPESHDKSATESSAPLIADIAVQTSPQTTTPWQTRIKPVTGTEAHLGSMA